MIKVGRFIAMTTVLAALCATATQAQGKDKKGVGWLTPEEMSVRFAETKLPILVDVFTNWCGFCKVMDKKTWKNDSVAAYVNSHFYTVKIDAESRQPYLWMGTQYNFEERYKANMLAVKLLEGRMSYPSTIIIPEKGEPEIIQGAFTPAELEVVLKYYGGKTNETIPPQQFQKKFKGNWK